MSITRNFHNHEEQPSRGTKRRWGGGGGGGGIKMPKLEKCPWGTDAHAWCPLCHTIILTLKAKSGNEFSVSYYMDLRQWEVIKNPEKARVIFLVRDTFSQNNLVICEVSRIHSIRFRSYSLDTF